MGIPSYFSYLLRKYPYLITSLQKADHLYLDSNSIVYDMVSTMKDEDDLIQKVCEKIDFYIALIKPTRVFIAFDGIPPMAKVKQQRERRFKGWLAQTPSAWNTIQITPGTTFMNKLDKGLTHYFRNHASRFESFKLSTSKEAGEGEHKLFEWIRTHPEIHKDKKTLIYGLDSDLIVLSLQHLQYGEIRLLREAPAFMLSDRELHILDIPLLATAIEEVIGKDKLSDYILMTLFLGNDFMPHFPAIQLRTTGFDILFQTYVSTIAPNEQLYNEDINWPILEKFIQALARKEESIMTKEYHSRNRYHADTSTEEKRQLNTPMLKREKEHFICPIQKGWQKRYYDTLLPVEPSLASEHYLKMFAWNMKYYTKGCTDWSCAYPYSYPPLLEDLAKQVKPTPEFSCTKVLTEEELLCYVLPGPYHSFIPGKESTECSIPTLEWSYCRYLWEAHVVLKT